VLASRLHSLIYRRSGGRLGRRWFGVSVMVMHTVGRRSGEARSTPVLYVKRDDAFVVLAANGGQAKPPAWWLNMEAAGTADVEVAGNRIAVTPRVTTGAERAELWKQLSRAYPTIEEYLTFTDREFPVVVLTPT
jgi:deazaflavin-dependent oxidoreductase (nitroreductase family)